MNKFAMISVSVVGGTALFAVSFLGFAKLNGVPLHSLPAVGGMFPAEPDASTEGEKPGIEPAHVVDDKAKEPAVDAKPKGEVEGHAAAPDATSATSATGHGATPPAPNPVPAATPTKPREAHAGIFGVLDTDGLYTQDELRSLADSLRAKNRETDQRTAELDRREDLLADRLTALDERRRTMDEFAKQLDARDRELKAREAEANRDAKTGASKDKDKLPAGDLSQFFGEGDTEILVQRLAGFTPSETAQILIRLPPARAKELLDGLPPARWRECAEAYARAAQAPPP